ncbi:MAG TPA: hypothetical protein PLV42_01860 [bacterium]|nr:hypothetical protein [bacterium]
MAQHLTEENLAGYLPAIFPGAVFVHNRVVPETGTRLRPAYRCVEMRLVVEFDGPTHYTKPSVILKDDQYRRVFVEAGYEVVRIPYFVQLSTEVIARLFGTSRQFKQRYPHGFVGEKIVLPAEFCCLGVERFIADLDRFSFLRDEILRSLEQKRATLHDEQLVYPVNKKMFLKRLEKGCFFAS